MSNKFYTIFNVVLFTMTLYFLLSTQHRINQFENELNKLNASNFVETDHIDRSSPIRTQLDEFREKRKKLSELHNEFYKAADKYISMLHEIKSDNSKNNQEKLESLNKIVDDNLSRSEAEFGLNTAKFIRMFEIAKYNNFKNLFSSTKEEKFYNEASLLALFEKLTEAEKSDIDAYNIFLTGVLLDDSKKYDSDNEIIKKISNNIDEKRLQSVVDKLKANRLSSINCVIDSSLKDDSYSEYASVNIAELQYQSRYCANLIGPLATEDCFTAQYHPSSIQKEFCVVVSSRLNQEAKQAADKYGSLTFQNYFEKNVAPLVSKYVSDFKNSSYLDKKLYCNIRLLPIVKYRDPEVDAYLAAYLKIAPDFCKDKLFL